MDEGRIVFAQLMDYLPREVFDVCVEMHRGNYREPLSTTIFNDTSSHQVCFVNSDVGKRRKSVFQGFFFVRAIRKMASQVIPRHGQETMLLFPNARLAYLARL